MNGEKKEEEKKFNMQLITRTQPTSDENPPWVGISFTEPVDSDTLAEQLRKKYPHGRTLRERKHMAAIDFLKDELNQMQSKSSPLTISAENLKIAESSYSRPPRSGSEFEGMPAENSRRESVSTCDTPESSLHLSVVVDQNKQSLERSPSADNVPISSSSATAGQQFVFSAVDLHPRQPKTKRKMTTEERTAYKETRKRGACLKCRRQKGRCTHNINDALTEPISPVEPQHRIQRPTAMDPISPVMVQNGTKRRNSASPGPEPLDHTKVLKFEHTSDIRQSSPSDPQPPVHHHNHHSSIQMRESTISGQMRPVPGDGQRGGTASSDQSAMYVSQTTAMEPFGFSPSTQQHSEWPQGYPAVNYFPPGYPEDPSQSRTMFQPSASPQDNALNPFEFYQTDPTWPNYQTSRPGNDDPT